MKNKSKFITFLLSFIPGLSHFYLGLPDRGLIYLMIFGAIGLGSFGMAVLSHSNFFVLLFIAGELLVWLIALIDAFSTMSSFGYVSNGQQKMDTLDPEKTEIFNKKIITLALSSIPGAGHMYLGYQQKGLLLMGTFFFSIFLMGWLNLSLLVFILPLIWFYSFFDAFHTLNGSDVEDMDLSKILPTIKPEYIGKGLIVIGLLIILQKVFYPILEQVLSPIFKVYIVRQIKGYIQTSIVSLIFIIGGIKMLSNKKIVEEVLEEEIEDEE